MKTHPAKTNDFRGYFRSGLKPATAILPAWNTLIAAAPAQTVTNGIASVTSVGLSRRPETHAIARVIGNRPLRQFLIPFPGGRFQTLEASYDPRSNQWFNANGEEDRQPGEWGHWTGRGANWNFMCASCHDTRLQKNYDETSDSYHTTMPIPLRSIANWR